MNDTLYVITPYFNSWRYKSRKSLYSNFKKYISGFENVQLITIEVAFADRPFEVTSGDENEIQLRTNTELWHKERSINLAINRLPLDWKYVAWIDGDIQFARPDWSTETIHLLQHFKVIQMFSESINLSPAYESIGGKRQSFMDAYVKGNSISGEYGLPHPGFAWAATREAINGIGGLFDVSILGSGDLHMARALTGNVKDRVYNRLSKGYMESLNIFQDRCERNIRRNIGCMSGLVMHYWHGRRADRKYNDRWKILTDNQYDPEFDIFCESNGLYQFSGNKPNLEYGVRNYFASRNEDCIFVG